MRPASAATRPCRQAATKAAVSRTTWSAASASTIASLSRSLREYRAGGNGRAGIPPHRLQKDIGLAPDLGELLEHHEAVRRIGDDDRTREQRRIRHPQNRILEG